MMTTIRCQKCEAAREEIEQLEEKIKRLEERIKAIRKAIKAVLDLALGIAGWAERRMIKGNLPRAEYAYLKGINKAAWTVAQELAKLWIWSKIA